MPIKDDPDRWARLRFSIIGPLFSAPPSKGGLCKALEVLAEKNWTHPVNGTTIRFSFATIERWYYAARKANDPVSALRRLPREDAGRFRKISTPLIQALKAQYLTYPGWTVQLHYDNLLALSEKEEAINPLPSYGTVRRYMRANGLHRKRRPKRDTPGGHLAEARLEKLEVRSYEVDYAYGLWHTDFHHGSLPVLLPSGNWVTPLLLCFIDDHSRLVCHLQWYLDETAETLSHGLSQAVQKRGLPRALMTDNGAAMKAEEFTSGLHTLGIQHETTLPYSPYQNAKQETLWATIEGRLMAMLEGVKELTLGRLNELTQAWVELDYHCSTHSEIGTTPLRRHLDAKHVRRESPDSATLRQAFRCTASRKQRRSDGTISLSGVRFEIPGRYRHLEQPTLRYARWNLRCVDLIDPRTLKILCPLYPLDKSANASGARRALKPEEKEDFTVPRRDELPPLLHKYLEEYAATGRPPAYLPKPTSETD